MKLFIIYLCIINVVSFVFMLADKQKAKKHRWRIPERVLLSLCAIGGSLGGLLAMYLARHKTKHAAFAIGIPVMLILHIGLLWLLLK